MSMNSRKEYLARMQERYRSAQSRSEQGAILDELVETLKYNRKYAIRRLNGPSPLSGSPGRRRRPKAYQEALPAIEKVWTALDYCCAERLHPMLLPTAEHLVAHDELCLNDTIRQQLAQISRTTLARRLANMSSPKARRVFAKPKAHGRLRAQVPVDRYSWDEQRPGALEIDLVEHNGGSSHGEFAYTLSVVDVVTLYSRRIAVLGRSQKAVVGALRPLVMQWPYSVWQLHTDNGSEFLNGHLLRFTQEQQLQFTRSRPYKKNDSPHVEQQNRQWVREIVGYERYDTAEDVEWLNTIYQLLDSYVSLFIPSRKVVSKQREGRQVRKRYDAAQTPFQRLLALGVLDVQTLTEFQAAYERTNPLALHHQLEQLLADGPSAVHTSRASP